MYDDLLFAVYRSLVQESHCSADDILVTPELRADFVKRLVALDKGLTEKFVLQRLIYLRKKGRLPRSRELMVG